MRLANAGCLSFVLEQARRFELRTWGTAPRRLIPADAPCCEDQVCRPCSRGTTRALHSPAFTEVSSAPHFAFRAGSPYHDLLLSLRRAVSRANRAGDFRTTGVTVSHFPRVPQSSLRSAHDRARYRARHTTTLIASQSCYEWPVRSHRNWLGCFYWDLSFCSGNTIPGYANSSWAIMPLRETVSSPVL